MADFIGDVNLIEGNAKVEGNTVTIHFAEGAAPITAVCERPVADGQRVSYAIRPEKISVNREPLDDRANHVKGKIEDIGYLGNVSTYHVRLPSGELVSALMTNSRRLARRDFTWEDEVWLSWTDTAGVVLTE